MVDIVRYPKKKTPKEEAINRLGRTIVAHLAVVLYDLDLLDDAPLQTYVRTVEKMMIGDGYDYDAETVHALCDDKENLNRVRQLFLTTLAEKGYLNKLR